MSTLSTQVLGMHLPNPFVLSAGPATGNAKSVLEAFRAGWGGAVMETVVGTPPDGLPQGRQLIRSGRRRWGVVDFKSQSECSPLQMGEELVKIREVFADRPVLASIAAGDDRDQWRRMVDSLKDHGLSGFEIHGGWVNRIDAEDRRELGQDPETLARAVRWVREVTDLPIVVKLSPDVTDLHRIGEAALQAGADGFTVTAGLSGLGGIDLDTLLPLPFRDPSRKVGSYRGPGLKPVALRWTASLAKKLRKPVLGCGGVAQWQDAAEFLAVGASAVQVGSAVEWEGVGIIVRLTKGLQGYLERKGFASPSDIVGKALPNLLEFDDLDLGFQTVAVIDETRCTGCDVCVRACWSGGYQAIERVGDVALVDKLKCDGCGLCMYVCPEGIIQIMRKEAA